MVGRTISHYRILDKLGEGGMGVVYKAEDTRLGRMVALKFLPREAAEDPSLKQRFLHEARAAAALDHPNICTLYEADEVNGETFLTMAYLEGTDLRRKIAARPLPLDEALDIAIQIGEGLRAAHAKGIVHRDIKSANVMVTPEGRVKIMDFGLARLAEGTKLTRTAAVMGTPAYMAPEQFRGEKTDRRADLWSLGVVLYEMICGHLPFSGESQEAVQQGILSREPEPLTAQRMGLPVGLDRVVAKALAKERDERYQHSDDLLVDLRTLQKESSIGTVTSAHFRPQSEHSRPFRHLSWILAAALAVLAIVALVGPWRSGDEAGQAVTRLVIPVPKTQSMAGVGYLGSTVAISRDGTQIAYVAREDGTERLYLRALDAFDARPIEGTEGARAPFFSPDGKWLGFAAGGRVKKVSLSGGLPETISRIEVACFGGDWDLQGSVLFSVCDVGLKRVSSGSGTVDDVTTVSPRPSAPGEMPQMEHYFPQFLPGGDAILFTISNHPGVVSIAVRSLKTGEQRIVIDRGSHARYVPSGHLVYAWQGDLKAVPFDADKLEVTGAPVTVLRGVAMDAMSGAAHFSVSDNGTLAVLRGSPETHRTTPAWVDRFGKKELLPFTDIHVSPHVLPGSRELLVSSPDREGGFSIWVLGLDRGTRRRLTDEYGYDWWPMNTLGGEKAVFQSNRAGTRFLNLFWVPTDGSGPPEQLLKGNEYHDAADCSPDGKFLIFRRSKTSGRNAGYDLWLLPLDGEHKPQPFLQTEFNESHPSFSPDGRWLAYATDESGRYEVMVRPFPGPGRVIPVSKGGGWEPLWAPDGRELYYRNLSGRKLMTVPFDGARTSPIRGEPALLFEGDFYPGFPWGWMYDVAPEGGRFLMLVSNDTAPAPSEISVVLNWLEELKQKVPATGQP